MRILFLKFVSLLKCPLDALHWCYTEKTLKIVDSVEFNQYSKYETLIWFLWVFEGKPNNFSLKWQWESCVHCWRLHLFYFRLSLLVSWQPKWSNTPLTKPSKSIVFMERNEFINVAKMDAKCNPFACMEKIELELDRLGCFRPMCIYFMRIL